MTIRENLNGYSRKAAAEPDQAIDPLGGRRETDVTTEGTPATLNDLLCTAAAFFACRSPFGAAVINEEFDYLCEHEVKGGTDER